MDSTLNEWCLGAKRDLQQTDTNMDPIVSPLFTESSSSNEFPARTNSELEVHRMRDHKHNSQKEQTKKFVSPFSTRYRSSKVHASGSDSLYDRKGRHKMNNKTWKKFLKKLSNSPERQAQVSLCSCLRQLSI